MMIRQILCVLLIVVIGSVTDAYAKEKQTYALSPKLFKVLEKVNLAVEENRDLEALEELQDAEDNLKRLSPYDKAQINYIRGSVYYKLEQEEKALAAFTRVMDAEGQMPEYMERQVLKTLLQLNLVAENYALAKEYGIKMIAALETPKAADWALLAQANYKMQDWQDALDACMQARAAYDVEQKIPKENLLLLQNAVYFELKQMPEMVKVLETLLSHYPKPTYVLYLASIYGQLDRLDNQTVLMEALYDAGELTESSQLVNLASLYLSEKVPYKAAVLLQKHMDEGLVEGNKRNYEMLSQAWRLAAEPSQSLLALDKAAGMSDDGELYMRKAYLHYDMAEWQNAETAVNLALDKGLKPEYQGEAWLLLGMTRFSMNQFRDAIAACEKAGEYEGSSDYAERWITYISNEEKKYNALQGIY